MKRRRLAPRRSPLFEVFPYGISIGSVSRSVLIFTDQAGEMRLPIWLGPIAAAASLCYLDHQSESSPFGVVGEVLARVGVKIERCVFDAIAGHRQMGRLYLTGGQAEIQRPADEVVALGLAHQVGFFASQEFARKSREMNLEMKGIEAHLKAFPADGHKNHRFLM